MVLSAQGSSPQQIADRLHLKVRHVQLMLASRQRRVSGRQSTLREHTGGLASVVLALGLSSLSMTAHLADGHNIAMAMFLIVPGLPLTAGPLAIGKSASTRKETRRPPLYIWITAIAFALVVLWRAESIVSAVRWLDRGWRLAAEARQYA